MNGNPPVSGRERNRLCNDNVFGFQFKNMEQGLGKTGLGRVKIGVTAVAEAGFRMGGD
jgi:hypothetical protein